MAQFGLLHTVKFQRCVQRKRQNASVHVICGRFQSSRYMVFDKRQITSACQSPCFSVIRRSPNHRCSLWVEAPPNFSIDCFKISSKLSAVARVVRCQSNVPNSACFQVFGSPGHVGIAGQEVSRFCHSLRAAARVEFHVDGCLKLKFCIHVCIAPGKAQPIFLC